MIQQSAAQNKLWYLKHINLFSALSMAELQEIDRITRMQEVKKRQPIYLPGDPANTIYLLKKGRVKIASADSSGKEVTFEVLEPGELFGELEVLEEWPRATMAEALDDTLICAIRREDFDGYLANHPALTPTFIPTSGRMKTRSYSCPIKASMCSKPICRRIWSG